MHAKVSVVFSNLDSRVDDVLRSVEHLMLEAVGVTGGGQAPGLSPAKTAAAYHLKTGGQRVRARLSVSAGLALGLSEADVICIAAAVELLHNASLIHDDLQDQDEFRRGAQTVWDKYGGHIAILSGDFLLSAAYAVLSRCGNVQLVAGMMGLMHERCAAAIDGQCADLAHGANPVNTVEQYLAIAAGKSGALLGLPIELVLLAAGLEGAVPDAKRAANAFAVGYQIADDLLDASQDQKQAGGGSALNILFVLQAAGHHGDARIEAKRIGLQHLQESSAAARLLPCDAGALFLKLAESMNSVLTMEPG